MIWNGGIYLTLLLLWMSRKRMAPICTYIYICIYQLLPTSTNYHSSSSPKNDVFSIKFRGYPNEQIYNLIHLVCFGLQSLIFAGGAQWENRSVQSLWIYSSFRFHWFVYMFFWTFNIEFYFLYWFVSFLFLNGCGIVCSTSGTCSNCRRSHDVGRIGSCCRCLGGAEGTGRCRVSPGIGGTLELALAGATKAMEEKWW